MPVVIAIIATLELAYFYTELPYPYGRMLNLNASWFAILTGFCMAVVAPLLAGAALVLGAAMRRFGLAAILLVAAMSVYWTPVLVTMLTGGGKDVPFLRDDGPRRGRR